MSALRNIDTKWAVFILILTTYVVSFDPLGLARSVRLNRCHRLLLILLLLFFLSISCHHSRLHTLQPNISSSPHPIALIFSLPVSFSWQLHPAHFCSRSRQPDVSYDSSISLRLSDLLSKHVSDVLIHNRSLPCHSQ